MLDLGRVDGFEWDAGNTHKTNQHSVAQEEAEQAFLDPFLLVSEDVKHSEDEPRFHALGITSAGRRLQISFTLRGAGTRIRIISARDMSRKERAIYAQKEKA